MCLSAGPIGSNAVGENPTGTLEGIPRGSLVFIDSYGRYLFTTPDGLGLPSPPTPALDVSLHALFALDEGAYLVMQKYPAEPLVQVLDSRFNLVSTLSLNTGRAGATNYSDSFYVEYYDSTVKLSRLSASGSVVQTWALAGGGHSDMAVLPDNTKAYLGLDGENHFSVYNLSTSSGPTPLVTITNWRIAIGRPAMIVLRNGNILVLWRDTNSLFILKMYDSSGSELATFPVGPTYNDGQAGLCASLDDASFWRSRFTFGSQAARIEQLRISDGAILKQWPKTSSASFDWANAYMVVAQTRIDEVLLRQLNYPTSTGTTDFGPTAETTIPAGGRCYITGEPAMPQLRASVSAPEDATSTEWSLSIVSERTQRGTRDNVELEPVELAVDEIWEIDEALSEAGFDFVGGACILRYRFKDGATYLGPARTFSFKIRGKNPLDADAKGYLVSIEGSYRFLWAICQHEGRAGLLVYNQFNAPNNALAGTPNWGDPDGWGLGQIEGANTLQTYNWKENADRALAVLIEKEQIQQTFFNAVARTYPNDPEASAPPSSWTPQGTTTVVTAMEAGMVTLYNGAGGCPYSTVLDANNEWWTVRNPWKFDPDGTPGQKWNLFANQNDYLKKVLYDEYEGHSGTQN